MTGWTTGWDMLHHKDRSSQHVPYKQAIDQACRSASARTDPIQVSNMQKFKGQMLRLLSAKLLLDKS